MSLVNKGNNFSVHYLEVSLKCINSTGNFPLDLCTDRLDAKCRNKSFPLDFSPLLPGNKLLATKMKFVLHLFEPVVSGSIVFLGYAPAIHVESA